MLTISGLTTNCSRRAGGVPSTRPSAPSPAPALGAEVWPGVRAPVALGRPARQPERRGPGAPGVHAGEERGGSSPPPAAEPQPGSGAGVPQAPPGRAGRAGPAGRIQARGTGARLAEPRSLRSTARLALLDPTASPFPTRSLSKLSGPGRLSRSSGSARWVLSQGSFCAEGGGLCRAQRRKV